MHWQHVVGPLDKGMLRQAIGPHDVPDWCQCQEAKSQQAFWQQLRYCQCTHAQTLSHTFDCFGLKTHLYTFVCRHFISFDSYGFRMCKERHLPTERESSGALPVPGLWWGDLETWKLTSLVRSAAADASRIPNVRKRSQHWPTCAVRLVAWIWLDLIRLDLMKDLISWLIANVSCVMRGYIATVRTNTWSFWISFCTSALHCHVHWGKSGDLTRTATSMSMILCS